MAPCRPKVKTLPSAELLLSGFAEHTWLGAARPWLLGSHGRLVRSLVVAPTRGHTQALKQLCVIEGIRLVGTEFLTHSLARRKRSTPPAPQRPVCALLLRKLIDARVAALDPGSPSFGILRSLASDVDGALDAFDELVRAGLSASHFPSPELREIFGALEAWFEGNGYAFAPRCDAAEWASPPSLPPIADRLLILAGGPENWPEFLGLAALAVRCSAVRVVVSAPHFRGPGAADEAWVKQWEAILGSESAQIDLPEPEKGCGAVGELWGGARGSAEFAEVLVGRSRSDEAALVADAVGRLVAAGSENIAVVLRGAGPLHSRLLRRLSSHGIAFADQVGDSGAPPLEVRVQRAIADFYERGCRMEEFLALWALLRADNLVSIDLRRARRVCQGLYDATQSSQLASQADRLAQSEGKDDREVGRVLLLLPSWPAKIVPAEALSRFEAISEGLLPGRTSAGWGALSEFASRHSEPVPAAAMLAAIRASLPERSPVPAAPGRGNFARVTLTTIRRAVGLAWSDAVLAEANSGSWPVAQEPGVWFPESARVAQGLGPERTALTLPGREAKADVERGLYRTLARDVTGRLYFTAASFSEENAEVALVGNPWLERVLFAKGVMPGESGGGTLSDLAVAPAAAETDGAPAPPGWREVWLRRRDPAAKFDDFFFGGPRGMEPARMSATEIERGVEDPVTLWFKAVLRVERVEWRPFARAARRALGDAVHDILATALRGPPAEEGFMGLPDRKESSAALERELVAARSRLPSNAYWDSFHNEASSAARSLLDSVYALGNGPYVAIEAPMPPGATVRVGPQRLLSVGGKMDVVLADRPAWEGATVAIVDFKTGAVPMLSAKGMASRGESLQLGVYLAAARSLGAMGAVWMLKPGKRPSGLKMSDLDAASVKLDVIGQHLESGVYGARTPDRSEYSHGFEWPLACAPIRGSVLEAKFALTFGSLTEQEEVSGE